MIHRLLFRMALGDALFVLAVSIAAYCHVGAWWLLYVIAIAAAVTIFRGFKDGLSYMEYLGNAISFHAKCIRDKSFDVSLKADHRVNHTGRLEGR